MPDKPSASEDFFGSLDAVHAQEMARGEHDDQCEYGPRLHRPFGDEPVVRSIYMCHCSKRRREAAGRTEPPELEWMAPVCTGCNEDAEHDGDGWYCDRWGVQWDSAGRSEFTDEYDLGEPVETVTTTGGVL